MIELTSNIISKIIALGHSYVIYVYKFVISLKLALN